MKKIILITASFVLTMGSTVQADTFRCPNGDLVATGDPISDVAVKCNPPTQMFRREEPEKTVRGKVQYITVEEWVYNNGPNDFIYTLVFRNGIMAEIRSGGYGN